MNKLSFLLVGVILLGAALAACAPTPPAPTPTVTSKPNPTIPVYTEEGTPIMIGVGQQFAVLLHSNPSTGYGWTAQFDAKALSQVSKTYESSQATPMPGSGGTDRFLFQGLTAGPADLKFTYARSFDPPGTAPAQTMIFKVTVK